MTRFTFGALNPLTVDDFTQAEISEYQTALHKFIADGGVL